jgi:superfamily II DNA or RNA helicase
MKFEELYSHLSSDSHLKGKSFEQVSKWWLTNDELWSSLIRQVWLWDEWPDKSTRDLGIDLVAEGFDGTYWAVQCKAYHPDSSLKKSDIDSFLSASSQKQFSNRLLITTTKAIGDNARNTLSNQEKPVQIVDWIRLNESTVDWSLAAQGFKPAKHTPRELRPHQEIALKSVISGLSDSDRGQLIMACGTGKTLTGLRIDEAMGNELTVLLVPSLTLLSQTLKDWLTDKKTSFQWLAVCSDDSVTSDPQDNARLIDYDIPATTDLKVIEKFLATSGKKVIFSTYQSSDILKSAVQKSKVTVDLVIADEAHRLAGKVGREFASFLDIDVSVKRRLFMTATPRIYANSIKKLSESLDLQILSMDDQEMFGKVLFRYSFSKAIAEGILSDYRVVVIGIDDISTQELFNERALVNAGLVETDSETLALHVALAKAMKSWNLRRVISFHSRVANARKFANDQVLLNEWLPKEYAVTGRFNATTISSSMPTNKRRQILDVLKNLGDGDTGLVSNARCLTEGIDVPTLDAVVFVDPKSSQVDIIQAIGRAIRLGGSNKTHGTVVVPVHVPSDKSSKDSFDASNYKKIGDVLNALRAHDEDFGEELDKLRTSLGQRGTIGTLPEKLIWDLPETISQEFASRIQAVSIEFATSNWEFMFGRLLNFVQINGHARPSRTSNEDNGSLAHWVSKQRAYYRSGLMTIEKIAALEGTHETWSWDPLDDDWSSYFQSLENFVKQHGHARPSAARKGSDQVGGWVIQQRGLYKSGKLSDERINALQDIHKTWSWDPLKDDWEFMLNLLIEFEKKNRHTRVESTYKIDGYGLGTWVHRQRLNYRNLNNQSNRLTEERISKLESLDTWHWNPAEEEIERYIAIVKEYEKEFGTSRVPINYKFEGVNCGKWVAHKREDYRKGKLSPEVINLLESTFPDWSWNPTQEAWEKSISALQAFISEHGHARVSNDVIVNGVNLGTWVFNIRSKYKAGRLPQEQIDRLESIHPTWTWSVYDQQWEEFFNRLEEFTNTNGHSNVGSKGQTIEERALYEWVNTQRKRFKEGKMSETRIARLGKLGFSFQPIDPWVESFNLLKQFAEREGHANVPTNHVEDEYFLGRWASTQRGKYRKKELSLEQINLLEKLKGWGWDR